MTEIDATVEEQEFLEASEAYAAAVAEKDRWTEKAKDLLKDMRRKHGDLLEAREGKTTLSGFGDEEGESAAEGE